MEGLAMEIVGVYYGHLVYFTSIGYILWPFGIFYGHLVYSMVIFFRFGKLYIEKSGISVLTLKELFLCLKKTQFLTGFLLSLRVTWAEMEKTIIGARVRHEFVLSLSACTVVSNPKNCETLLTVKKTNRK
jgi:hypothetical protein